MNSVTGSIFHSFIRRLCESGISSLAIARSVGEESPFLFTCSALLRSRVRENYLLAPLPVALQEANTLAWAYFVKSDTWERAIKFEGGGN